MPHQENEAKDEEVDQLDSDRKEAGNAAVLGAVNIENSGDGEDHHQDPEIQGFEYAQIQIAFGGAHCRDKRGRLVDMHGETWWLVKGGDTRILESETSFCSVRHRAPQRLRRAI